MYWGLGTVEGSFQKCTQMTLAFSSLQGNYRTGLAGTDLNRKWKSPDEDLHPTIFYMKNLMERMRDERGIGTFHPSTPVLHDNISISHHANFEFPFQPCLLIYTDTV